MNGTSLYRDLPPAFSVPTLVRRAVTAAEELDFPFCVHPATGRLLHALAGGVPAGGTIGETGTGTGAGLAWMAAASSSTTRMVSAETDPDRAAAATALFEDDERVTVLNADARDIFDLGPFDLLVLDGGWGSGKSGDGFVEPTNVLTPEGIVVIDDLWPMRQWPPMTFDGDEDTARMWWLAHDALFATEVRVADSYSVLIARRRP